MEGTGSAPVTPRVQRLPMNEAASCATATPRGCGNDWPTSTRRYRPCDIVLESECLHHVSGLLTGYGVYEENASKRLASAFYGALVQYIFRLPAYDMFTTRRRRFVRRWRRCRCVRSTPWREKRTMDAGCAVTGTGQGAAAAAVARRSGLSAAGSGGAADSRPVRAGEPRVAPHHRGCLGRPIGGRNPGRPAEAGNRDPADAAPCGRSCDISSSGSPLTRWRRPARCCAWR